MALAKGSFWTLSANTRAISGIAGDANGVASKATAVAANMTNSPCALSVGGDSLVVKLEDISIGDRVVTNPWITKEGAPDFFSIDTLIKLTLDCPASEIAPIQTLGENLAIGATATASSERNPKKSAQNVVAADAKEFSEGIFVKSSWGPASKDAQPWLQLQLAEPKLVSQLKLMEGRFGSGSRVQKYVIEANVSNDWKTVHSGGSIGGDCNILLASAVKSDTFRVHILKWDGYMDLNSFELYE